MIQRAVKNMTWDQKAQTPDSVFLPAFLNFYASSADNLDNALDDVETSFRTENGINARFDQLDLWSGPDQPSSYVPLNNAAIYGSASTLWQDPMSANGPRLQVSSAFIRQFVPQHFINAEQLGLGHVLFVYSINPRRRCDGCTPRKDAVRIIRSSGGIDINVLFRFSERGRNIDWGTRPRSEYGFTIGTHRIWGIDSLHSEYDRDADSWNESLLHVERNWNSRLNLERRFVNSYPPRMFIVGSHTQDVAVIGRYLSEVRSELLSTYGDLLSKRPEIIVARSRVRLGKRLLVAALSLGLPRSFNEDDSLATLLDGRDGLPSDSSYMRRFENDMFTIGQLYNSATLRREEETAALFEQHMEAQLGERAGKCNPVYVSDSRPLKCLYDLVDWKYALWKDFMAERGYYVVGNPRRSIAEYRKTRQAQQSLLRQLIVNRIVRNVGGQTNADVEDAILRLNLLGIRAEGAN